MANILVLSASVGAGHLRAAQAIELALRRVAPQASVTNIDVLTMTNAAFRRVYGKAYLDLVNHAPYVLGYMYDKLDRKADWGDSLRRALQKLNLARFTDYLCHNPWDLVINTHFLPAEMIARLRRKNRLHVPQVTVTTDFETHRLWVNQPCDRYYTATQEGAHCLAAWGVPIEHVEVHGIPIHPVFAEAADRDRCLAAHDLAGDRPVALQLAGGFGVGPIERIFRALLDVEMPIELVVVAGRNEKVRDALNAVHRPARHRVHVLGFTDKMDELLAAADLVVSKPGGLTTSEALARGVAMCVVNPIPGQETRNCDFLLENGCAIKANNLSTLSFKVGQLLADAPRLARLKRSAKRTGQPHAAFHIARSALQLIGQ